MTDIESDHAPKGLNEDTVRFISAKKNEPEWMLDWRLAAYRRWLTMTRADLGARPLSEDRLPGPLLLRGAEAASAAPKSLDEVDPEILETYEKLGIPLREQEILAGVERDGEDGDGESAASRSTRCSIPSRSRRPSRRS